MKFTQHYIGRNGYGDRVFVEIKIDELRRPMTTIDHKPVTSGATVSMVGQMIRKGSRTVKDAGQIIADAASVVDPAPGWSHRDVSTLVTMWRRWHVNHMRPGCAHMDRDAGIGTNCGAGSGYSHGSAWLYEAIPGDDLRAIERLQSLPKGDIPAGAIAYH